MIQNLLPFLGAAGQGAGGMFGQLIANRANAKEADKQRTWQGMQAAKQNHFSEAALKDQRDRKSVV